MIEAEKLRLDGAIRLDAEAIACRIAEGHAWLDSEQATREAQLAKERAELVASKQARVALYSDIERGSKQRDLEAAELEAQRLLQRQNALEEQQTRRILAQLESERLRDREARMELILKVWLRQKPVVLL